jgi:hypothetical protein
MQENYPASIAALTMEQSLRHIVISLEMAKVEDLKQVIIGSQAFVIPVIRKSTKVKGSTRPKGYRCLRIRTDPRLVNFLNEDLLKYDDSKVPRGLILIPWLPTYNDL